MFKVNTYWDGHKVSEVYHHYDCAVKAFKALDRISRDQKANGEISEYYVELIKED